MYNFVHRNELGWFYLLKRNAQTEEAKKREEILRVDVPKENGKKTSIREQSVNITSKIEQMGMANDTVEEIKEQRKKVNIIQFLFY